MNKVSQWEQPDKIQITHGKKPGMITISREYSGEDLEGLVLETVKRGNAKPEAIDRQVEAFKDLMNALKVMNFSGEISFSMSTGGLQPYYKKTETGSTKTETVSINLRGTRVLV